MPVKLWRVPACNGWAGGAVERDLTKHVLPVDWPRMTGKWDVNKENVRWCSSRGLRGHVAHIAVTWMSRVLGIQRKLTVTDSFFINSEAMSPNPAPWSQSKTRSKFVRICTALDHENSPSKHRERGKTEKKMKNSKRWLNTERYVHIAGVLHLLDLNIFHNCLFFRNNYAGFRSVPSHLSPAKYWARRYWWRRKGNQRFVRWVVGKGTPPATASGSSDTLPPVQQPWAARRTRHPPLFLLPFSLLPLQLELHPSLSPSPQWRMGWCPGGLEEASTASLWTERMKSWVNLFLY